MTHARTKAAIALAVFFTTVFSATESFAQRGRVRVAPRRAVVVRGYYAPVRPFFYRPFFYDPWYDPYWPAPRYLGQGYIANSSIRLEVTPREAEVFVDGYYAGVVDAFDGVFQRLRVEPGEHDIELYLQGYRIARERIYVQPGTTFRIRQRLEPLGPGDTAEPRPSPAAAPPQRRPGPPPAARGQDAQGTRALPQRPSDSDVGTLAVRVQPADAEVFVDDERWRGPSADEQLILQVGAGAHRIEVRREGYRTYTSEVDVREGETATLNVSLSRQ